MNEPRVSSRRRWSNDFIAGLLVLSPAFVTFLVVRFLVRQISRFLHPTVRLLDPWLASGWVTFVAQVAALLAFVVLVIFVGRGARLIILQRAFGVIERWVARLPMVGKLYSVVREITQTFGVEHKAVFSRVVLVEWVGKGRYVIGFVTQEGKGELQEKTPEHVVHVFIPTTPNPTSGFLILADREALIPLAMSVEDGMKLVISGGMVGPMVPPSFRGESR